MPQFSLDIESNYDLAEMNNVFGHVCRQLTNRYDLKNTQANIEWLNDKKGFKLTADHKMHLEALIDMVRQTAGKRNLNLKVFDLSQPYREANFKISQDIPFKKGLKTEDCKRISKILRAELPKIKIKIQGDTVRLSCSNKDQLQLAMKIIKEQPFEFPVNFTNFK